MANYAVVRTDNLRGTDVRAGLVSIKYIVSNTETAIENGNVLLVGPLMDGEREIFQGSAVAADSPLSKVVLIATPELMYDKVDLTEFINPAGKPCRGYYLHSGDIFSVTKEALAGAAAPAVGNVVELAAGTKLNVAASATSGSTAVGKIIAIDTVGRLTYYAIQVD